MDFGGLNLQLSMGTKLSKWAKLGGSDFDLGCTNDIFSDKMPCAFFENAQGILS